jgi:hypothetical protein
MATRADFTDEEWKTLQEGITGAGMYVALVDRGFFDNFKEANALAHHLKDAHEHSDNVLIRDLATGHERPFGMTSSPEEVEQSTVAVLGQAVATLQAKAPDDLPAYRQLVVDVAQSVAEAAKGVSDQENQALDKIRAALGDAA